MKVWRGGHKDKKPDAQPTNGNEASVPTMSKISTGTTPSEYHCSYWSLRSIECVWHTVYWSQIVQIEEPFVTFQGSGKAQTILTNITGLTQSLQAGTTLNSVAMWRDKTYTTFMLRCATMKPFKIKAIKTYVSYVTTFIILRNMRAQTQNKMASSEDTV